MPCAARISPPPFEGSALVQLLAALLQAHLPHPWGLIVATSQGETSASASWGLSKDEAQHLIQANGIAETTQGSCSLIRAGNEALGYLLLAPLPDQQEQTSADQTYYQATCCPAGLAAANAARQNWQQSWRRCR
ncbi:MAG: hypothetical protein HC828_08665 [Blastochloris sp.]|nr:hypothetical protein [Blastochloris sp.]